MEIANIKFNFNEEGFIDVDMLDGQEIDLAGIERLQVVVNELYDLGVKYISIIRN